MTNNSKKLYELGQSIWYDNIQRKLLKNGELAAMIASGKIYGVTSNPSIFNNAISKSDDYDDDLEKLAKAGKSAEEIYEALAIADTLVRNGMFSASAWSEALGEALREAEAGGAADDQSTYYQCVLSALEKLVASHSEIDRPAMAAKLEDWERAYLSTPHGQPVKLDAE